MKGKIGGGVGNSEDGEEGKLEETRNSYSMMANFLEGCEEEESSVGFFQERRRV